MLGGTSILGKFMDAKYPLPAAIFRQSISVELFVL